MMWPLLCRKILALTVTPKVRAIISAATLITIQPAGRVTYRQTRN